MQPSFSWDSLGQVKIFSCYSLWSALPRRVGGVDSWWALKVIVRSPKKVMLSLESNGPEFNNGYPLESIWSFCRWRRSYTLCTGAPMRTRESVDSSIPRKKIDVLTLLLLSASLFSSNLLSKTSYASKSWTLAAKLVLWLNSHTQPWFSYIGWIGLLLGLFNRN